MSGDAGEQLKESTTYDAQTQGVKSLDIAK